MIRKIKTVLLSLSTLFILATPALVPTAAVAASNPQESTCYGANNLQIPTDTTNAASGNCSQTTGGVDKTNKLISTILNIFSVIVGIVAVIMIIIGGFHYVTSGGSQEKVKKAKDTLLYAIIGLIIVALAQIIVKFVLNKATQ